MNQEAVMVPAGDWRRKRLSKLSERDQRRHTSASGSKIGRDVSAWVGRDKAYPSNVLHGSPVTHNTSHSAAYPEWLPEFFIKLFSDEGDLVLDPFVGSGTTVRVAERLRRRGVGIDINPTIAKDV